MSIDPDLPPSPPPSPPKRQDHVVEHLKNHPREVISFVILVVGIILLFFQPVIGGILVGLIAGIYFSDEIISYIADWSRDVDEYAFTKHIICFGIALAFFIAAPAIFVGIAIAIGIKLLFVGHHSNTGTKS